MNSDLVQHLRDLPVPPVLDVLGRWVHLRNARTGTTSMDEGPLRGRCIMHRRNKHLWETVWNEIIVPNELVLPFTFVRNPWGRICSAFYQCRDRAKTDDNKIDKQWQFKDWVKQVLAVKGPSVNMHFAEQYPTAYFDGTPLESFGGFVGRFEQMNVDWPYLASRISASEKLPHWNAAGHGSYVEHHDDETQKIIGELYRRDIEAFGYEFGQ